MKKKLAILGATGSIGTTTLDIVRNYIEDFEIVLLANNENLLGLEQLIKEFKPLYATNELSKTFYKNGIKDVYDKGFLNRAETYEGIDIVINGIVGIAGLAPSIAVLQSSATLATANKESFVTAGKLVVATKEKHNAKIIPIDSEHSTIWQCIGSDNENVQSIILTASGGAFRGYNKEQLFVAKAKDALKHPTWVMGKKVTIDCATLMNKGMEIIEAKYLFGTNNIEVVQHNESIIHSMVLFKDNTIIAGMSNPDMTLPIQYALTFPKRKESKVAPLNFAEISTLNFGKIDEAKFPCFGIAKRVSKMGDCAGNVMNSSNEVAVKAYLDNQIGFYDISDLIANALDKFAGDYDYTNLEEVYCMDKEVSEYTFKRIYGGR